MNILRTVSTYALLIRSRLTNRKIEADDWQRELAGRSIALVGNARSLLDRNYGDQIDMHDIVIRFNGTANLGLASHGKKLDVLACARQLEPSDLVHLDGITLLWTSPKRRKMGTLIARHPKLVFLDQVASGLSQDLGARPSSGCTLLHLLSLSKAATVDIYGFDFYESGSTSGEQTAATTPHDYDAEARFARSILQKDNRFTLWK